MATSDQVKGIDSLTKDERQIIVDALELLEGSRQRAFNTTKDAEMKDLISRRISAVVSLRNRFFLA